MIRNKNAAKTIREAAAKQSGFKLTRAIKIIDPFAKVFSKHVRHYKNHAMDLQQLTNKHRTTLSKYWVDIQIHLEVTLNHLKHLESGKMKNIDISRNYY